MPTELLPCPLEHEVIKGIHVRSSSGKLFWHLTCHDCGLIFDGRMGETCREVFARWNQRTTPPEQPPAPVGDDRLRAHLLKVADYLKEMSDCEGGMCTHCIDVLCDNAQPLLARQIELIGAPLSPNDVPAASIPDLLGKYNDDPLWEEIMSSVAEPTGFLADRQRAYDEATKEREARWAEPSREPSLEDLAIDAAVHLESLEGDRQAGYIASALRHRVARTFSSGGEAER